MTHREQKIGDLLHSFSQDEKVKTKLYQVKIEKAWENLFGKTIANYTRKVRLKDKTLIVQIDSSSLREELHFGSDKLMAIVNAELGENFVTAVKITQ